MQNLPRINAFRFPHDAVRLAALFGPSYGLFRPSYRAETFSLAPASILNAVGMNSAVNVRSGALHGMTSIFVLLLYNIGKYRGIREHRSEALRVLVPRMFSLGGYR